VLTITIDEAVRERGKAVRVIWISQPGEHQAGAGGEEPWLLMQRDPPAVPSHGGLGPGCASQCCRDPVVICLLSWVMGMACLPACWGWLWGPVLLSRAGGGFAEQRPCL